MIAIVLSILCSTGVLILFKLIPRFAADTSHTIFISYAVSGLAGLIILPVQFPNVLQGLATQWFIFAAIEGAAFYVVFQVIARSASVSGIAFTGLASKMSVIIPITIGLLFLGDAKDIFVIVGVALGLVAVVLSVSGRVDIASWQWPVLVFLGTGVIDASFKLFQVWGLPESQFPSFIILIFSFAFLTGLITYLVIDRSAIALGSFLAGFVLGLLNLGTVYFIMKALATANLDSTWVYALNSFGIVLMSMLVAITIFKESISKMGYAGVAVAIMSILSLTLSHVL